MSLRHHRNSVQGRRRYLRAFTLAEMVIVTLIIAILSAIAVPRYIDSLAAYNVDSAARKLKVDLEYLRQIARKNSASVTITFDATTSSYSTPDTASIDRSAEKFVVFLNRAPYSATIFSAVCGTDAVVVINGFGKPDSSATIVLAAGTAQRTVVMEATTGKVAIQ